ncbi:MAG: hypothetical protein KIT31_27670 [Deltaproteobacteria bacterium]|nr:hypothetical protein [Deltaproteobacteria bacterium]
MGGDDPPPDQLSTTEQSIFAQVPGFHKLEKDLSWDQVATAVGSRYALASWTTTAAGYFPENVVNAVYRDSGGCVRRRYMSDLDGIWRSDATLQSCDVPGFSSDVGVAAWGPARLDVFWFQYNLGGSNRLLHAGWDGAAWFYEDLGATATFPTSAPAVASWSVGHLDVLWRDNGGQLRWRSFDRGKKGAAGYTPNGWSIAETVLASGVPDTQISAVSEQLYSLHVGFRTSDNKLRHHYTVDGTNWNVETVNTYLDSPPSLVSWGSGHLVAYARRGDKLIELTKSGTQWSPAEWGSTTAFGDPVAGAARGRAGRIDLLSKPANTPTLNHTLFQESLLGFQPLANPQPSYWCWLATSGAVVNWIHKMTWRTCDFASNTLRASCCGKTPPEACLETGSTTGELDDWNFSYKDDKILTVADLRYQLQVRKMPVISHHDVHGTSTNHVVVIYDIYAVNGIDYVVISDPADRGSTWVQKYSTYLAYNTNWHVDHMIYNFALK